MTRPAPEDRPTARDLASKANGREPMQIGGKPADACPYCGAGMFIDKTQATAKEIVRYIYCRNRNCGKRFLSHQPPAKILREVGGEEDSAAGKHGLTLHKEAV